MAEESISVGHVREMLTAAGFAVDDAPGGDNVFTVKELESGMTITCALEETVLFNTLPCLTIDASKVTLELTRRLLDADNGVSSSFFQLYDAPGDKVHIALCNFCTLQNLGPEDEDDVLSCLSFLEVDAVSARQLLADYR